MDDAPLPPDRQAAAPSRWFWLAVTAVLALALWHALAVARAEWFSRDDFAFLLHAQRPFRWLHALLPLDRGFWWAWRPLGMDGFFQAGYRLFGLDPFGWFALAIAVHFALGPVVWALARRTGLAEPAAVTAGALAVVAPPVLTQFAYASVFHYIAANLLGALALLLFRVGQAPRARVARGGAALSLSAALLCNESSLVLVGVAILLALRDPREPGRDAPPARALAAIAPLLAVALLWVVLRLFVVDLADPPAAYRPRFGANLWKHFWMQPRYLAGGGAQLVAVLIGMAGVLAACVARARSGDPTPLHRLGRAYSWLVPWLLAAIAVFAALPFSAPRFAMTLQVPGALLIAAHLDALWRLHAPRRAALLRAAFAGLLLLALPLHALRERAANPSGPGARAFVDGVARAHPAPPRGTWLVVVYGSEGQASRHQIDLLRRNTYNGTAIRAMRFPQLGAVRFVDAAHVGSVPCAHCLYVEVGADLEVRRLVPRAR